MGLEIDSLYWKVKLKQDELDKDIAQVKRKMAGMSNSVQKETQKVNPVLKSIGKWVGIAFSTAVLGKFMQSVMSIRGEFQKYEAVLTNTLGSGSRAQEALANIQQFAAQTPFQITELTEAFVKLANRGFEPTIDQMRSMGDLASSVGKSYDQLTEAILDATVGEWERMKEFGIKARQEGELVTISFKGQQATIENTEESVRNYILSLGRMKGVGGAMEGISKTLVGMTSNLRDSVDALLNNIGQKTEGFFAGIISGTQKFVSWLAKINETKASEELRRQKIEFNALASSLKDANTPAEIRNRLIDEINAKYGEYLPYLLTEKNYMEALRDAQDEVNATMDQRISKMTKEELLQKKMDDVVRIQEKYYKYTIKLAELEEQWKEGTITDRHYYRSRKADYQYFIDNYKKDLDAAVAELQKYEAYLNTLDREEYSKPVQIEEVAVSVQKLINNYSTEGFRKMLAEQETLYKEYENAVKVWGRGRANELYRDLGAENWRAYLMGLKEEITNPELQKILAGAIAELPFVAPKNTLQEMKPVTEIGTVSMSDDFRETFKEQSAMYEKLKFRKEELADIDRMSYGDLQDYIKGLMRRLQILKNIHNEQSKIQQEEMEGAIGDARKLQLEKLLDTYKLITDAVYGMTFAVVKLGMMSQESADQLQRGIRNVTNAIQSKSVAEGFIKYVVQWGIDVLEFYGDRAQRKLQIEAERLQREMGQIQDSVNEIDYSVGAEKVEQYTESLTKMREELTKLQAQTETQYQGRRGTEPSFTEQLEEVSKAIEFWQIIREGGSREDQRQAEAAMQKLEALKSLLMDYRQLTNQFYEELTGTTSDAISGTIARGFTDGLDSVKDFGDTMEDIIRNALLRSFQAQYIDQQVQQWYESFGRAAEDGLTAEEVTTQKLAFEAMMSTMTAQWDNYRQFMQDTGILMEDASRERGLAGAIKGITEDTASVLAGQIGAIRFNVLEQLEIARQGLLYQKETAVNTRRLEAIENYLALMTSTNTLTADRSNGR